MIGRIRSTSCAGDVTRMSSLAGFLGAHRELLPAQLFKRQRLALVGRGETNERNGVGKMTFAKLKHYLIYSLVGVSGAMIALPAAAQNPYKQSDDTWITIRGQVASVLRNAIMLDYGHGTIAVDIDDTKGEAEAYRLLPGDKVTVFGLIDKDSFAGTTIQAASVYVDKTGKNIYATVNDPDDLYRYGGMSSPTDPSITILRGFVSSIDGHEFTLNSGDRAIEIETAHMSHDPLTKEHPQIKVGDIVRIRGHLDDNLFKGRRFAAESIDVIHKIG